MNFKASHTSKVPLLICNVWDVQSAKIAKNLKFKAIGTSSGAIATMLGYKDGEEISFEELLYIVGRIRKSCSFPLSVDLESGYSRDPMQVADNIDRLVDLGVVGINIEDSIVNEKRTIVHADQFAKHLDLIVNTLSKSNLEIFINVRTDTFLLGLDNPIQETIERARKYTEAGANGIFVPCIEKIGDIKQVAEQIDLPLNVMCMPKLPSFRELSNAGVKRISMGNFVFDKMGSMLQNELESIIGQQSFEKIFN